MYQLHFKTPAPLRRSFATDVPRVDLDPGRHPVSGRLWAGMAAAAVVAAVSVGALSASVRPPAAETSTAAAPVVRADTALPVDPATDAGGSSDAGLAGVLPAGTVPADAAPAAAAPAEAPPAETPPAPPPPGLAAPSGDSNLYTVVPGDTVGAIAARFGVDLNGMLAANGLGTYSIILPGQTLKLSGPAVAAPPAPASAPAPPAQVTALVPAAPAVRTIYVAGSGGQSMLDACIGPIHYTPNDGYSLFITEHDFCGGWARFSGISVGETVSIPGYGTYTATARGQVPNPGTTNDVINVFGGFPRAILQTCIPGTSQMLLIALN